MIHYVTAEESIDADGALEREISIYRARLLAAGNSDDRRSAWMAMSAAIQRRSSEQVAKMEREQGLTQVGVGASYVD